ncbi:MAG: hypothetical protein ACXV2C_04505 [Candidatus Bathyarchaeia archaeon]
MKAEIINSKISTVGIVLLVLGVLFYPQTVASEYPALTYGGSLFSIIIGIFLITLSFTPVLRTLKQLVKTISIISAQALKRNKRLLCVGVIALIFSIAIVAIEIDYISSQSNSSQSFPIKGNIAPPFNQMEIRVQYKGEWVGTYGETNSTQLLIPHEQVWNGTGDRTAIINRTNGASPWIIFTETQGFGNNHKYVNMTVSILLLNGTALKSESNYSGVGATMILNVDIDNLTRQVDYDYWNRTVVIH